jgi:hypothetical protein
MACLSTSLEEVVKNSEAARKQVENLQKGLEDSNSINKKIFEDKRDEFFKNAGLDDITNGEVSQNIKVEFASEFSLEKVIPVVKAAIEAAVALYAGTTPVTGETKKAFSDLVVAIGECAKFSSSAVSSMSFASNRLSPGLFVSLYASSVNIKDTNMFGGKAVTATMYYYQLSKSNKDIAVDMKRVLMQMYAEGVISLNKKIIALGILYADGGITEDVYKERKKTIESIIKDMKPSLSSYLNQNLQYREQFSNMLSQEKINANLLFSDLKSKNLESGSPLLSVEKLSKEYNGRFKDFI